MTLLSKFKSLFFARQLSEAEDLKNEVNRSIADQENALRDVIEQASTIQSRAERILKTAEEVLAVAKRTSEKAGEES